MHQAPQFLTCSTFVTEVHPYNRQWHRDTGCKKTSPTFFKRFDFCLIESAVAVVVAVIIVITVVVLQLFVLLT